jgi:hypothetical protein
MATKDFNRKLDRAAAIELIQQTRRLDDDYMDATSWCKLYGKEFKNFRKLESTRSYIDAACRKLKVTKNRLLRSTRGKGSRTFAHPLIFLELIRWLDEDIAVFANEIFQQYLEGNADLGLDLILRDHNKRRLERAKSRLRVVDANKQVAALAVKNNVRPDQVHNDRYRGLYQKTCGQLRSEAQASGIEKLRNDETPLNLMSTYDLAINELANLMALKSDNPNAIFSCSSDLREVHEKRVGKPLVPEWKDNRMQPGKARQLLNNLQMELPV